MRVIGFVRLFMTACVLLWTAILIVDLLTDRHALFQDTAPWWRPDVWCQYVIVVGGIGSLWCLFRYRRVALTQGYDFHDIFDDYFLKGRRLRDLRSSIQKKLQRQTDWEHLVQDTKTRAPELLNRISRLREIDDFPSASNLLDTKARLKLLQQEAVQSAVKQLMAKAELLHCPGLIQALIDQNRQKVAKRVMAEIGVLLARADALGVSSQAADILVQLTEPDLTGLYRLLRSADNAHKVQRLKSYFDEMISRLGTHDRMQVQAQLNELVDLPYDSREFRMARHRIESRLKALGVLDA